LISREQLDGRAPERISPFKDPVQTARGGYVASQKRFHVERDHPGMRNVRNTPKLRRMPDAFNLALDSSKKMLSGYSLTSFL
jgi:hypothetical protein